MYEMILPVSFLFDIFLWFSVLQNVNKTCFWQGHHGHVVLNVDKFYLLLRRIEIGLLILEKSMPWKNCKFRSKISTQKSHVTFL